MEDGRGLRSSSTPPVPLSCPYPRSVVVDQLSHSPARNVYLTSTHPRPSCASWCTSSVKRVLYDSLSLSLPLPTPSIDHLSAARHQRLSSFLRVLFGVRDYAVASPTALNLAWCTEENGVSYVTLTREISQRARCRYCVASCGRRDL